ncbi:hypothetical protein Bca52824_012428 [Brassica carinata]|uniref:Uncharacterized protein n=1 Tax=Brassica carinata TaxID=52824 RepID=A0A8X7VYT4_BRACI|nr:hypothetical protein Bca52824_012428 [Brassica carinata]
MMTTRMYGSQRPMVNLLFPRIQGMSLSDVELRLDYILIRDEAGEYLEESKLKDLVKRYSEFINFPPIHLWASKEKLPLPRKRRKKMPKKKKKTAIWLRSPKEVTEEEYTKFYHSLTKDKSVKETAQLMCQTALIESGFILNDPKDFAGRIYSSVKSSLKISPDAVAEEEVQAEETESSEEVTETKSDNAYMIITSASLYPPCKIFGSDAVALVAKPLLTSATASLSNLVKLIYLNAVVKVTKVKQDSSSSRKSD